MTEKTILILLVIAAILELINVATSFNERRTSYKKGYRRGRKEGYADGYIKGCNEESEKIVEIENSKIMRRGF